MEIKEKISVVIVNFNAGPGLVDSVRTVIADASEVIIVDNDSFDGSLALLESAFSDNPKLRIIQNGFNEGFAKACNRGVAFTTSRFILFLNPDCELEKDAMACLVQSIDVDPKIGMVGGLILNQDGSEQAGARRSIPTPWRSLVRSFGLSRYSKRWPKLFSDFYLHKELLPKSPIEVEAISGACMMVKRDAMLNIGLLDEEYFMHCEDIDWCMRFRRGNWKILFVPDARMLHHKGMCSKDRLIFVEFHKHKGMIRFYRKFFMHQYPSALMWLVALGVWLRFLLVALHYTVRRFGKKIGLLSD